MVLLRKWQPRFRSIRPWDPFVEIADLRRQMDEAVGEFFGQTPPKMVATEGLWSPLVDVHETKDGFLLQVELPGVKQEDIQVSIEGDTLTLRGERKRESKVDENQYYRVERNYGGFQRSIVLPCVVDPDQVKATYRDGVLEIRLPKKEEAKAIKVEIA